MLSPRRCHAERSGWHCCIDRATPPGRATEGPGDRQPIAAPGERVASRAGKAGYERILGPGTGLAIAIPQFAGQNGKGYDARVMQDARNAATGEEGYFSDTLTYFTGNCALMPGVVLSPGVVCTATGAPSSFTITTTHPQATRPCTWTSNASPNLSCS